ncbi:MAG: ribosome biogenesis GTPase Der [Bacteroidales bacterium]|nr:ribosome biogenesis GTPase Der [Bacteroidales bacterium]
MSNILAIVGRPNVGKSTFFNRLAGQRSAIEEPTSGVTRDRHYGKSDWNGAYFSIIDTGGYVNASDDIFEAEIKKQVFVALEEADVILFMVDITEGITPMDQDVAQLLRKAKKPVLIAVNKADNHNLQNLYSEFYALGFDHVYPISAVNGSGTGELLDDLVTHFEKAEEKAESEYPKVSIVGRPNAGKSSILNTLMEEDRFIVTPMAGTTRDSVYTHFNKFGYEFDMVDTAGIRKKTKVYDDIEFFSIVRSVRAIENSDICVLVIDATRGIEAQDLHILGMIVQNNKGLVIVVNKWDLVEKDHKTMDSFREKILERIAPTYDVPMIFTSATEKIRVLKILESIKEVHENRSKRITTSKLNNVLLEIFNQNPPPMYKGKRVKIKYITQLKLAYPAFVIFCNSPQYVKDAYKRYAERQIRNEFGFTGATIKLYFREK